MFNFFSFKSKKKTKRNLDSDEVKNIVQQELEPYLKREDVQSYLNKIEHDKEKKKIWDGLSNQTRLKLLRYAASKKNGERSGK